MIKVGDRVIVEPDANGLGGGEYLVARVGRKNFGVWSCGRRRTFESERTFEIATGREKGDGVGGYCYAFTPEQYAERVRRRAALKSIGHLDWHWHTRVSTEGLEAIAMILARTKETKP